MTDQPTFRDRTNGLIAFGVVQLLGGLLALVLLAFSLLGSVLSGSIPEASGATAPGTMAVVFVQYAGAAGLFFTLGVGSILCRRWARTLSLLVAWILLIGGCYGTIAFSVLWPTMEGVISGAMSGSATAGGEAAGMLLFVRTFTLGCLAFFFILLPAVFVLFYRSPHVKATCELKDPKPRWTDRRPLPILALTVMLGAGVLTPLYLLMTGGRFLAVGFVVRGGMAFVVAFGMAALSAWCAWRIWHLDLRGWWVGLVYWLSLSTASFLAFGSESQREFFEELGMPAGQIEMMGALHWSQGSVVALTAVSMTPILGFYLYTRRYFDRPGDQPETTGG
jgi:hypothetical protein